MESLPFLIALLACPLVMLTLGGIAWIAARVSRERKPGEVAR